MDRIKLKTFVALTMDIASASPRRYFFEARANILNALFHEPLFYSLMSHINLCVWYVMPSCHSSHDSNVLLQVMSFFATAEHEKEKLQYFASPEGRDDLYQYNQKESRTVLEVRMFALKIFFSLNKFHTIHALACRTILAIMCLFCPSVAFHG